MAAAKAKSAAPADAKAASATALTPARARILIVDDSRIVRAAIVQHIRGRFDYLEAADGEAGWTALSADTSVRVLISDLQMPALDGYALLERIRASAEPRIRDMPVIIISGDDEETQRERASLLGATDFITKGVGAAELVARLEALSELAHVKRELVSARVAVSREATTDTLTALGTLNLLVKQGASMFSYAQRHRVPLAVVRIGLDHFEDMRRTIGDPVADQILVAVARLIAGRMRKEDVIARADAAEFAIASPATTSTAAYKFASRLGDDIRGARIVWQGRTLSIAASIGIADSFADPSESFADVYATAGRRLERARRLDGDRVITEDEERHAIAVPQAAKMPSIEQALAMLAAGRGAELDSFVHELALKVYPLVKYCDDQFTAEDLEKFELAVTQKLATLEPPPA